MFFYLSLLVLPLILFFFVFGLNSEGIGALQYPWKLHSDYDWSVAALKGLLTGEWQVGGFFQSQRLAAPFGFSQGDFPGTDQWHLVLIKIISFFTKNPYIVANSFYIAGFCLSSLSMGFLLRKLQVSRPLSFVGAISFAFLPYHFYRLEHLFLAQYSTLPLIIYALWVYWNDDSFPRFQWKSLILFFIFSFICVGSGIYYAFFTCYFFTVITLIKIYKKWNSFDSYKSIFRQWTIVISILILQTALQLLPFLIYRSEKIDSVTGPVRSYRESLYFALRLKNILMPMENHRVAFFRYLKSTFGNSEFIFKIPNVEGFNEYIGLLGVLGFFISSYYIVRFFKKREFGTLEFFSLLLFSGLLLGFPYGVGFWFNYLVSPQIRCYNRVSIFIAGFAILVSLLQYQKWIHPRSSNKVLKFIPLLLIILVLMDQTSPQMHVIPAGIQAESDKLFFREVEKQLPKGSNILQLPYVSFPEGEKVFSLNNYDHFRAYTNSQDLNWSFGIHKESKESKTISELSTLPLNIEKIKEASYDGIYIDRLGFKDAGQALEMELITSGYRPIESPNKDLVFFSLINKK